MKTIRILFYTDTPELEMPESERCVSDLRTFIALKLRPIAEVKIDVRFRHHNYLTNESEHAATKLTECLLKDYDELWVIGFGTLGNSETKPANVLTDEEVKTLCTWMKTHGVLVTGDHSQSSLNDACKKVDHKEFRSMGYTLGHRIPRANQLRVWQGPPTNCIVDMSEIESSDTCNTQEVGDCAVSLDEDCLQEDKHAQTLEAMPHPPHFLFTYDLDAHKQPIPITKLPDHLHEGRVLIPDSFNDCWPPRPPLPQVVAKGCDKRFPVKKRIYDLVVVYDGDEADISHKVGRIVADTSFHHFINLNLRRLSDRDLANNPKPGTDLDQIAQFHANLAYWLAPEALRDDIRKDLLFRAAKHLNVIETIGNGTFQLGKAAKSALESQLGAANLFRIFEADGSKEKQTTINRLLSYALVGSGVPNELFVIGREYLLGSIMEMYHEFFHANDLDPIGLTEDPMPPHVFSGVMNKALRAQSSSIRLLARQLRKASITPSKSDPATDKPKEQDGEGEGS